MISTGIAFQFLVQSGSSAPSSSASSPASFSYVVNIWMENQNYGSVIGSSSAPYETQLANTYSTDTSYHNLGASCGCSLPEYMGFFAGQYPDCATSDGSPSGCTDSSTNLVDILEMGGVSWIAYAENYPVASGCYTQSNPGNGGFYDRHFMFNYYSDIVNSPSRCAKLFNSGGSAGSSSDSAFLATLNQASGWPNFIWLSPNGCNQTHDCGISTGDTYLAALVPQILSSNMFMTGKAALVITWDDNSSPPNIQAGPVVKQHYVSTVTYNHYSWLKTIEWNWGLSSIASGDGGASPMTDIFRSTVPAPLTATFTFSPTMINPGTAVAFSATASGGTPPYLYRWSFGDNSNGTGQSPTHSYSTVRAYVVSLTVQDSASPAASYTVPPQTVTVLPIGNPSITFVSSPSVPQTKQTVAFTSTVLGGQSPYAYSWTFGDGGTSTAANPSHTYAAAKTYTVGVTVTDSLLHTGTASATIIVISPPPIGTGTFTTSRWTLVGTGGSINSNGVFHINFNNTGGSWGFTGAACAGCPPENQIPVSSSNFINKQYLHLSGRVNSASSLGQAMYVEASIYYQLDLAGFSVPLLDTETQATHWENGAYASSGYSYVGNGSDITHGAYGAWREVTIETHPGSTFNYTIDLYALFNRGVAGLGLPAGTTGHLVRIEPGVEGYGIVSVDFYTADTSGTWPVSGSSPLSASLIYRPSAPQVNQTISFKATVSGGTSPYSYSWAFGDGSASGSGQTITHIYTTQGSYSASLTVTDSGGHAFTTVAQTVAVTTTSCTSSCPAITGNLDSSFVPSALSPSTAVINNGILTATAVNPTATSYTGSYYAFALKGAAPWWDAQGLVLSASLPFDQLSVRGNFLTAILSSDSASFKVETRLYFRFATTQTARGFTGNWLDIVIIFSNYDTNGGYSATSSYIGHCGTDCLPYREIIGQAQPGQAFSLDNFSITAIYQKALAMFGLPTSTQATLYGVQPGVEGYGIGQLVATFTNITLTKIHSISPMSLSISYSPSPATVGNGTAFTATVVGGIAPYTYSWTFADSETLTGNPVIHQYYVIGPHKVKLQVTDSVGTTASITLNLTVS